MGESGNVSAGSLMQMIVTISGLNSWTNGAASGGVDAESDAALCGRLIKTTECAASVKNPGPLRLRGFHFCVIFSI